MRINDLLNTSSLSAPMRWSCQQFLQESAGIPVYKLLPATYNDVHKVKVRQQKRVDDVTRVFNEAFSDTTQNFRQRAVITYSEPPLPTPDLDLFYVFPTTGYKYIYSTEISNSSSSYKHVIDTVFERFDNSEEAAKVITDIVKYTYTSSVLVEGLKSGAEIIFYSIPNYYAIRQASYPSYQDLIKILQQ